MGIFKSPRKEIQVKENTPYQFTYEGKDYQAHIWPSSVMVESVGSFTGDTYAVSITKDHVCGLQGFGQDLDDVCYACNEGSEKSKVLHNLEDELIDKGIIKVIPKN